MEEKTFHRWRNFDIGCLQCSTFCSVAHDQRARWRHGRWRRERSKHASQSSRAAGRDTRPSHAVLFCDVQTLRVPVPVIACGFPRVPERSAALCVLRHGYRYRPLPYTVLSRIITAPIPLLSPRAGLGPLGA